MVAETDATVANLIDTAGEESLVNLDCPAMKDAEPRFEQVEDMDEEDEDAELYACGAEFVGSLIQDVLDEEDFYDGEAHVVVRVPDASIVEGDESEEEDFDACTYHATDEDCFKNMKSSAAQALLSALDDGRLHAAVQAVQDPPQKQHEMAEAEATVKSILINALEDNSLEKALMSVCQKQEDTPIMRTQKLLVDSLDNGSLEAAITKVC